MDEKTQMKEMAKLLKESGFELEINGCGYCGSPYVVFKHKGRIIAEGEKFNFDSETINGEKNEY